MIFLSEFKSCYILLQQKKVSEKKPLQYINKLKELI